MFSVSGSRKTDAVMCDVVRFKSQLSEVREIDIYPLVQVKPHVPIGGKMGAAFVLSASISQPAVLCWEDECLSCTAAFRIYLSGDNSPCLAFVAPVRPPERPSNLSPGTGSSGSLPPCLSNISLVRLFGNRP